MRVILGIVACYEEFQQRKSLIMEKANMPV
jgi:hypothetical protein